MHTDVRKVGKTEPRGVEAADRSLEMKESPDLLIVAGARPNFMKIAPIWRAVRDRGRLSQLVLHTGQHHDFEMSRVFFEDLELPEPGIFLGPSSGTHAEQTGKIMQGLEKVLGVYARVFSWWWGMSTRPWPVPSWLPKHNFPSPTSKQDCDRSTGPCQRR